jgi:hypothetical protein
MSSPLISRQVDLMCRTTSINRNPSAIWQTQVTEPWTIGIAVITRKFETMRFLTRINHTTSICFSSPPTPLDRPGFAITGIGTVVEMHWNDSNDLLQTQR